MKQITRIMMCPKCGYRCTSTGIGAVYCGPHKSSTGELTPAVRMREVLQRKCPPTSGTSSTATPTLSPTG